MRPTPGAKRLAWFAGLYLAGLLAFAALVYGLKTLVAFG
ncbi:MAG TPA: DUF2474 domain-containing protein [Beijerinckiaceae bacterium]